MMTCLCDAFYTGVAEATVHVLEAAGCRACMCQKIRPVAVNLLSMVDTLNLRDALLSTRPRFLTKISLSLFYPAPVE